ncbi:MAG TPA: 6-O-methylguanine DNA methyltransferase [Candidatus Portnoybacteria bacterium]|uniref:6-O-methylguanine DNA methyltransferase n=1 Tax=Candidatus Portnoybacteria bacterium CG02_land_8_20_14_3_00_45_8 TaxID=1974807 RepID=A0A2M7D5T0_9BACT|nr:MAG: 6-O-methylguanine DNA methyltransferase [Candidatus Portnoybacteria bacterium CG02_land_8_20_14_3_00_45_8]HCX27689.1 6-O-methylguanine DNA methyltransferase [Candidatus Portnoybacteria bacterium]
MDSFQNRVFAIVKKIPRGRVLTYQQVAAKLDNKNLARAVGNALNKNRDSKVPCHRVVRSDGRVGRFNRGAKQKELLLAKEGVKIKNSEIVF